MKIHYHPGNLFPSFVIVLLLIISLMAVFSIDSTGSRAQPGKVSSPAVNPTVKDAVDKAKVTIDKDYGKMPLAFIPNKGQMDRQVYFYLQGKDKSVYFTSTGLTYSLNASGGSEPFCKTVPTPPKTFANEPMVRDSSKPSKRWVVKLDFVGARKNVKPGCLEKSGTVISYFKGKPEAWQAGLPAASKIIYRELWPGIDLVYYGTVNKMKYEFIVHPGADPAQIKLAYRGAESVMENSQGQLEVQTPEGGFVDDTPAAWQEMAGKRESVALKYALENRDPSNPQDAYIYGFSVGEYDKNETLILDPVVLVYCGYIGGSVVDCGYAIAVDASGCAYVTGITTSTETTFPVTVGPDLIYNGGSYYGDTFVAKIEADGSGLVYCGYIGGLRDETGNKIAVDGSGCAYVTGYTFSDQTTFPVTVGPDLVFNGALGDSDAYVAKIKADGTALDYCGYIGGSSMDSGHGIAVDGSGCAYISGSTDSNETNFPVAVGPDLTNNGPRDAFVAKVNAAGTGLVYCGYIGGSNSDYGQGIAVDGSGYAYISGFTSSTETSFPVTIGPDLTYNGGGYGGNDDAFVAKVKADGTGLVYCGYIGGLGEEHGFSIAMDGSGCAYVTGSTQADQTTFPVTAGPDLIHNGGTDAFVAKVRTDGTGLVYCGYIGGYNTDSGYGIVVDGSGCAYVTGWTYSDQTTFPVTVGPDLTHNGGTYDAFVTKVKADGTGLDYCGYIGGSLDDGSNGIALDGSGCVYIAGYTQSTEATFPVTVGPDLTNNVGTYDTFVAKISSDTGYTVNFAAGNGGALTGETSQTVDHGGNCSAVEAVPDSLYQFVNWTGTNGFVTTTDNPLTVTNVTADMTITANFAINTYTVTFTPDSNGTLTGITPQVVNYGTNCTAVEAVPNTGFHFVNWTGTNGFVTTTNNPLTVSNVTANMTITANFAINTYTVTFVPGSNGSLTGVTPQTVNYGSNCTAVEAVPNTGYHFVNWTGTNGFVTTTDNPLTVSNVTADMTITANFAIIPPIPIQLGAWSTTTPFNTPRQAHTSVVYNGYLYVLGGCDTNDTRYNDVQYAPINADGSLGTWQVATPFNTGRRSHTSVAYNGYLYVIGGTPSGGGVRNDVQFAPIYADGSLGPWQNTTSFNTGRLVHSSVVYNGYLYVIQGFYYSAAFPLTDVQFAHIEANGTLGPWQNTTTFAPARWGHQSIAYNQHLYTMGGWNWNGSYYTLGDVQYSSIDADGTLNAWQGTTALDPDRASFGLVQYGGNLIMTGGNNNAGYWDYVQYAATNADATLGPWTRMTSFNKARAGHTGVVHNGYLYVIGGTDNTGTVFADVQYAKINEQSQPTHAITFVESTGGTISGSLYQVITDGEACAPVTAVPNTGYHFVDWTGTNGFVTTTDNPLTVSNVTADMTITANFAIDTYTVTFVPDSNGTLDGVTPQTVNYGNSCTAVEAVPNTGYHFVDWTGTNGFVTTTGNPLTVANVTADMTITANFAIDTYTVTFVPDSNGTLDGITPQTVNYGSSCTPVTAVPNPGYRLFNWTGTNGFVTTTDNPLTVANVTADMTITANFLFSNLTGRVIDSGNNGIANLNVKVYDLNQTFMKSGTTDSNGDYVVPDLAAGSYKVFFDGASAGNYLSEWYNDKGTFEAADVLTLDIGHPLLGIDAQLTDGGTISGQVRNYAGTGLENVEVKLYDLNQEFIVSVSTDANGDYVFYCLPAGDYKLYANAGAVGNYISEWYKNTLSFDEAETLTVTAEMPLEHIDLVLATGGQITGRITNQSGQGIQGVRVIIRDLQQTWIARVYSDGSGNYSISHLVPDLYKVFFDTGSAVGMYVKEWYNDKENFSTADIVVVPAGETTTLDATLTAGGEISGTVTNGTDPIESMEVDIYGLDSLYIASGYTDSSGNYLVRGLPVGTYKVNFNPWDLNYHGVDWYGLPRNYDYRYQWYNQKDGFVEADVAAVTVGNTTTGIDAVMDENEGGIIGGRITDSTGNGIPGCYVCAFESFDNQLEWYYSEIYTGTGSDGNYEIKGLPTGNYIVLFFSPSDTLYKREYYNNTRDHDLAARVPVTAGQTTPGIDAVLEKGGLISGRVTDSKGNGLEGVWIRLMEAATNKYLNYMGNMIQTDEEGYYEAAVNAGQWKVMFQTFDMIVGGYVSEFYNNRATVEDANIVTAAAEETTSNIDAVLSMGGGKISGYVKDPANTGLRNAQVQIFDTQYHVFVGLKDTDSSGYFEVSGLIPGNYKVYTHYHDVYPSEWYSDQTAYETAKSLAVTTGGNTYIEVVLGGDDPVEPGTLRVTSPNGGESLTGGTVHPITWTAAGMNPGKKLIIEYTLNNGTKWIIIATATVGAGSYNWTVPAVNSGTCRVKIAVDEGDAGISDISDESFGIVSAMLPTIKLLSPKRWFEVTAGTTQNITWTGTGNIDQVAIEYSTDSGMTWSTITNSAPNTGSYQWAVPDTPSPHCRIRIRLEDGGSGSMPFDMTDYDFVILTTTIPSLTVTSPNGGEAWTVGSAQTITWVKTGNVPNVKIEYTVNNGSTWNVIVAGTVNTGSYPWTVPNNPSTQCKVRISDIDGNPTDMSNAVFSIQVLTLILTSPNGGEPWEAGTKQDITWTGPGGAGEVAIEYTTDSGTTWNPVTSSARGGVYRWSVPGTSSENCLVRIKQSDTQEGATDVSDEVFTIEAAPLIAVEVPNGGEKWKAGETYPITWTAGNLEGNVVIDLYRGDDFDYNIGTVSVNEGRLEWKIPGNFKNGTDYRVVIHKDQTEDASDTAFTITYKKPNHPDFDNDGKVDIIAQNQVTGQTEVWYMEGSRRKAVGNLPPAPMVSGMKDQLVGTGDFNRDGKVDILWRRPANGQNLVWYMDGIILKGTALLPPQPDKNWQVEGTGDFNGDGKTDIIWRQVINGRVQVWILEGVTVTGAVDLPSREDLAWRIVGTGDFNGDEKTDLLWRNEKDGRNEVWNMDGLVRTGAIAVQEQSKMQWKIVGIGDFNGDRHPDILWRRSTDGKYQVWYMDGVVLIGNEYINIPPDMSGSDASDLN